MRRAPAVTAEGWLGCGCGGAGEGGGELSGSSGLDLIVSVMKLIMKFWFNKLLKRHYFLSVDTFQIGHLLRCRFAKNSQLVS